MFELHGRDEPWNHTGAQEYDCRHLLTEKERERENGSTEAPSAPPPLQLPGLGKFPQSGTGDNGKFSSTLIMTIYSVISFVSSIGVYFFASSKFVLLFYFTLPYF